LFFSGSTGVVSFFNGSVVLSAGVTGSVGGITGYSVFETSMVFNSSSETLPFASVSALESTVSSSESLIGVPTEVNAFFISSLVRYPSLSESAVLKNSATS
jgi:hypothetical protein